MNNVVWKPIKGYEGLYEISNTGLVKSLSRERSGNGKKGILKEKLLKCTSNSDGYPHVKLYKKGKSVNFKVHRLVVEAFIKREESREYINHLDGNKTNNNISNLERCTPSENIIHAYENDPNPVKLNININALKSMANKGMHASDIAEVFKCSPGTIRRRARANNIKIATKTSKKIYKIDKIELIKKLKTHTQRAIAKNIGCSESLIYLYKKQLEKEGLI